MRHMGDAVQLYFEWNCDLLFDFFRRVSGPLRDDLGVGIGDVRVGLDRQIVKRNNARDKQDERQAQHQDSVVQSEIDEKANHLPRSARLLENASALATTSAPAFSGPSCNCWYPSSVTPWVCTSVFRNWFCPSLRNTQSLSCNLIIAALGTTRRNCIFRDRKVATAYIFGFKTASGLRSTIRTFADLRLGSSTREMSATLPW